MNDQPQFVGGLEGVVATESSICSIDGPGGNLYYRGYSIFDLTRHVDFEEATYLLLYGELPRQNQRREFVNVIRSQRALSPETLQFIRNFPRDRHPMEMLQSILPVLNVDRESNVDNDEALDYRLIAYHVAQVPTIVAAYHRLCSQQEYIAPRDDLSHGANFLYMLHGEAPKASQGKIMDTCLLLHAEHSLNASTFTARVVASTLSPVYCALSAAIGALFGRLHGGANEHVVDMAASLNEENARQWVLDTLERHEKIMGMGHRVYKVKDPRATIMEELLQQLPQNEQKKNYYAILKIIERTMSDYMKAKNKPIYPNVDFFSGAVYKALDIPKSLFTPLFAIARVSGWLAHIYEQRSANRLYRPKARYIGKTARLNIEPIANRV